MVRIASRCFALAAIGLSVSACGAAVSASTQSTRPSPPTYAQVIAAMAAEQSAHMTATLPSGSVGDVRSDGTGSLLGKLTVSGVGSFQFYVRFNVNTNGTAGTSVFDAIPDAGFAAKCSGCHITPNVCYAFSPAMQHALGMDPTALNNAYTPAGFTRQLSAAVPAMTVQGTTVVDQLPVYVFKGSSRELDVPYGSRLPVRFVHPGALSMSFGEWNSAGPITKPASCLHPQTGK